MAYTAFASALEISQDLDELRENFVNMLKTVFDRDYSSDESKFFDYTCQTTASLKKNYWTKGGDDKNKTCCNEFAGHVAQKILGLSPDEPLASCLLDLSRVNGRHPGSWIRAGLSNLDQHPEPGDFLGSVPLHVRIVTDIDPVSLEWRWIAAGMGRVGDKDWIKWGPVRSRGEAMTFAEARPKVTGWVDLGTYCKDLLPVAWGG